MYVVGHHLRLSDQVVNRFTQQTLSTVNRKHFFMNILFPTEKRTTEHSSSTVAILTTETSL
jgi:hypothetical protein